MTDPTPARVRLQCICGQGFEHTCVVSWERPNGEYLLVPAPAEPDRRPTASTITDTQLDQLYAELETAKQFARTCAKDTEKAQKRQRSAKLRADLAETELRTLRTGLRANGADPTQIQNLWAQIHLRNRQWREEKQRAKRAEADRDAWHDWADTLAYKVAPPEVLGRHEDGRFPWADALDMLTPAAEVEKLRQRAERAEAALAAFKDQVQAVADEARGGIRQQLGYALAALDEHQEQP